MSRAAAVLAVLALLAAAGCRSLGGKVVVLGDSNSCMWPDGCSGDDSGDWVVYMTHLAGWPGWKTVNRALPSMAAGDFHVSLRNGEPASGAWHLERLIRDDLADACVPLVGRFVVRTKLVIALGTNDLRRFATGTQTGLTVISLYDRAIQVPCVDVYVATIPPLARVDQRKIDQANAVIVVHVPANRVIPFGSQPVSDLDGAHLTDEGKHHRAELALRALFQRS